MRRSTCYLIRRETPKLSSTEIVLGDLLFRRASKPITVRGQTGMPITASGYIEYFNRFTLPNEHVQKFNSQNFVSKLTLITRKYGCNTRLKS